MRIEGLPEEPAPRPGQSEQGSDSNQAVIAPLDMGRRAAPAIVLRAIHQPGPDRIHLDVPGGRQEVRLIKNAGGETALSQVAPPALAKVHATRVPPMGLADRPAQAVGRFRHHDQMHVVGHQAVRPHGHAAGIAPLGHQVDVGVVIVLRKERPLPAVAALRQVMRQTRGDDTSDSRHGLTLQTSCWLGNRNRYSVPGIMVC